MTVLAGGFPKMEFLEQLQQHNRFLRTHWVVANHAREMTNNQELYFLTTLYCFE